MSASSPPSSGRSFFALFDFSFREFVTPRIIRVLYVLALIIIALYAIGGLIAVVASLADGAVLRALFFLLLIPVGLLLAMAYVRVLLEIMVVVFRIGENIQVLADAARPAWPPPATGQPGPRAGCATATLQPAAPVQHAPWMIRNLPVGTWLAP